MVIDSDFAFALINDLEMERNEEIEAVKNAGKLLDFYSPAHPIDLSDLSKSAGLNAYRFMDLFVEIFGCIPR